MKAEIQTLLSRYDQGALTRDELEKALVDLPAFDMGFARIDHLRQQRSGCPEVIFAPGKSQEQVLGIFRDFQQRSSDLLIASRCSEEMLAALDAGLDCVRLMPQAGLAYIGTAPNIDETAPKAAIVSAGTSDSLVAEEAAVMLELMGHPVERIYDVGVAGLHRLLGRLQDIRKARMVIVVAGMEGALASVVAGLVSAPVVGVPTSIGYGASAGGISALLSMLGSCSPGIASVNIDNGFGAAMFAHLHLSQLSELRLAGAEETRMQAAPVGGDRNHIPADIPDLSGD